MPCERRGQTSGRGMPNSATVVARVHAPPSLSRGTRGAECARARKVQERKEQARAGQCVYRARVRATHPIGVAVVRHSVREVPAAEEGERCRVSEEDRDEEDGGGPPSSRGGRARGLRRAGGARMNRNE